MDEYIYLVSLKHIWGFCVICCLRGRLSYMFIFDFVGDVILSSFLMCFIRFCVFYVCLRLSLWLANTEELPSGDPAGASEMELPWPQRFVYMCS